MDWKFPCTVGENYVGDTFKLDIDIGFSLKYYASVRLDGVKPILS